MNVEDFRVTALDLMMQCSANSQPPKVRTSVSKISDMYTSMFSETHCSVAGATKNQFARTIAVDFPAVIGL